MSWYSWAVISLWCTDAFEGRLQEARARGRENDRSLLINGMYSVAYRFLEQMAKLVQTTRGSFLGVQLKYFTFLFIDKFIVFVFCLV